MKKIVFLILVAVAVFFTFSSCKKLMCRCVATGYVSDSKLNEVLQEHLDECVYIAETEPIYDDGVQVSCEY